MFPDRLKVICDNAFTGCKNLSGSLIIPEGVEEIRRGAFTGCSSLNGSLSLPSTLKKLGTSGDGADKDTKDEGIDYYNGVFQNCSNLTGRLIIPDGVEIIRGYCFSGCRGLYGELKLPSKLRVIGQCTFSHCENLTGSIEIPQGVSSVPSSAFARCGFNGTLTLPMGLKVLVRVHSQIAECSNVWYCPSRWKPYVEDLSMAVLVLAPSCVREQCRHI